MPGWSIGLSEHERLTFTLLSPPAGDEGYEWMQARVTVAAGGFRGDCRVMITLTELVEFQRELRALNERLKGEAVLATIEDQVGLSLTMDKLGSVKVTGHLMDQAGESNKLTFGFGLDQTFLKKTISELDRAIGESR